MALLICADCGNDVSDQAPACPNCGRPAPVDDIPTVDIPERSGGPGEPALLLMISGGVLLAAGLALLVADQAAWASACLLTGVVLGVGGRVSALMRRRKYWRSRPNQK
jgi:hypothetical protein